MIRVLGGWYDSDFEVFNVWLSMEKKGRLVMERGMKECMDTSEGMNLRFIGGEIWKYVGIYRVVY